VNGTVSGSRPMPGFGTGSVESAGSTSGKSIY
jgi:hypothetical protein